MDVNTAKALVRSLIGRSGYRDSVWRVPKGRLSPDEMEALRLLSRAELQQTEDALPTGDSPTAPEDSGDVGAENEEMPVQLNLDALDAATNGNAPPEEGIRPNPDALDAAMNGNAPPETEIRLNLDALDAAMNGNAPPEAEIRLCIDFGTAMSKICAVGEWDDDVKPLRLGRDSWAVPSSLYIGGGGEVRFGEEAEIQHRRDLEIEPDRERFDNIKGMLSSGNTGEDLFRVPLPAHVDPTRKLTQGDALLLYLAWITDLGCEALKEHFQDGPRRYIRRRFAIPCFANEEGGNDAGQGRGEWVKRILEESLLHAQIIADTLTGKWSELTVEKALPVLRECRRGVGSSELRALFAKQPAVLEPLAAGASLFAEQAEQEISARRRRLLVIDVGAGTTDAALFQAGVRQDSGDIRGFSLVLPSVRMSRDAGNKVDEILIRIIQEKHADRLFRMGERERRLAIDTISARIRDIKSQLFEEGEAELQIGPSDGSISISDVEADREYKKIGERMKKLRRRIFEDSIPEKENYTTKVGADNRFLLVHVLLTGGSSVLPVFQDLASGSEVVRGWVIEFEPVNDQEWQERIVNRLGVDFEGQYRHLAVAIGGAAPQCFEENTGFEAMILPSPQGRRRLPRWR